MHENAPIERPISTQTSNGPRGQQGRKRKDFEQSSESRRSKVAQACEECRARKVRCDGVHPVCGACRRRHRTQRNCVYQIDESSSGYSAEYVSHLRDTINKLSQQVSHQTQPSAGNETFLPSGENVIAEDPSGAPGQIDLEQNAVDGHRLLSQASVESPGSSQAFHAQHENIGAAFSEPTEGVDGMGNIGLTDSSYEPESSSAASFMRTIREAVATRLYMSSNEIPLALPAKRPSWADEALSNRSGLPSAELFVLPSRRACDEMLDVYWDQIHVLYPFLHRPRFLQNYQALWTGQRDAVSDRSIYSILNIIFALCCQVTRKEAPREKETLAGIYFGRAKELLLVDLIGGGSLALIQTLLLMGQYLQSTEWPHRCWVVIGLAIRVAQGLGLNLPKTSSRLKQQQDREMVRRLWHGCIFMDRMVSMTLGRPMMISRSDALAIPLPASIDDDCLSAEPGKDNEQLPDRPSKLEFFIQSLKLFQITEATLSSMYAGDSRSDQDGSTQHKPNLEDLDFNTIISIESSLRKWNHSIPEYLKLQFESSEIGSSPDPVLKRQANILHLRYRQNQILLFRPILSQLLVHKPRSEGLSDHEDHLCLTQAMALPCAQKCIIAASAMIDLIATHQTKNLTNPPHVEALPAWWYQVFFLYTAATALIPARIYSHVRGNVSLDTVTARWSRSLDVLTDLSNLSDSAKRCNAALQLLNGDVNTTENKNDLPPEPSERTGRVFHGFPQPPPPQMEDTRGNTEVQVAMPGSMDPSMSLDEYLAPMAALQDFSWLDSLPVDLMSTEYGNLQDLYD